MTGYGRTYAFDYKFRKKDMAITIKTNATVNTEDKGRGSFSVVFFQRLIVIIQQKDIIDDFSYELYTRPTSLFEKKDLMNETHKLEFKNALFDQSGLSECAMPDIFQDTDFVFDGESLFVAKTSMDCWKHVEGNMPILQNLFVEQLWDS